MNRFQRILSVLLIVGLLLPAAAIVPSAATAEENCSIEFDPAGGSVEQTVISGLPVNSPVILPKPEKSYVLTCNGNGGLPETWSDTFPCTFLHWKYTDTSGAEKTANAGEKFTVRANVKMTAVWLDPYVTALPEVTRGGHHFLGWSTDKNGEPDFEAGSAIAGNTTLYAVWDINTTQYSVTLDARGGEVSPSELSGTAGSSVTLPVPTKKHIVTFDGNGGTPALQSVSLSCVCTGWYTLPSGTAALRFEAGAPYTLSQPRTLYARWENPTLGTLPEATCSGCTLLGWSTSPSGEVDVTGDRTITDAVTFYAVWKEDSGISTVTLDPMGGTVDPRTVSGKTGTTQKLPTPTKGYMVTYHGEGGEPETRIVTLRSIFIGWNTARDGSGENCAPGTAYTFKRSITLYAYWSDPTLGTLPEPTRSGYRFVGWFTQATDGVRVTSKTQITKDTDLYARWEKEQTVVSCVIVSPVRKQVYRYKEAERDYSGLALNVRYANGSSENISNTDRMQFSGFSTDSVGTKTVTVTYGDASTTFEVRVRYVWWQVLIRIFLLGFLWY